MWYCANISLTIGRILDSFGIPSKALEYHNKSSSFNQEANDESAMAGDYGNIGNVYFSMGDLQQALKYHNKALDIDKR